MIEKTHSMSFMNEPMNFEDKDIYKCFCVQKYEIKLEFYLKHFD